MTCHSDDDIISYMPVKNAELKKQVIRYIIYLIIVLGLTSLSFYLFVRGKTQEIFDTIGQANFLILLIVFGIIILCIILRSIVVFFLTRTYYKDYSFHRSIAIDQIGTLYRMVTPAGLGSHIMELHTYRKQGVSISDALSILAMYSIVYQIVLILYNFVTIVVKAKLVNDIGYINFSFDANVNLFIPLWVLITIGFIINLSVIGFILLLSYWNGFYRFISGPISKIGRKLKLIKDYDAYQNKLAAARDNFRKNLSYLLKNWKIFLIAIVCFFAYITLSYSTPYFVGISLGNTSPNANFWDSVLLSNFHQMITSIIPIPGQAFSSELFFFRLFYSTDPNLSFYSSEDIARASLLLWRTLMFIIPLGISLLFTLIYRPRKRLLKQDENQENKDIEI